MSEAVEFGTKADADAARKENDEWVCPGDDDRRKKTVHFVSDTPDRVLDSIRAEADESRHAEAQGLPLAPPLSEGVREKISDLGGFDGPAQTTITWRKAKAIYAREGHPEWFGDDIGALTDYDDPSEGAEQQIESRRRGIGGIEAGATGDGGGARNVGEEDERARRREERAAKQQQAGECDHARDHCEHGDPDACEFLAEVCGLSESQVADIMGSDADGPRGESATGEKTEEWTADLDGPTLGALHRALQGYQGAVNEADRHLKEAREAWENANQAARAIQSIREEHGQPPQDFERMEDVQGWLIDFYRQVADDCEDCHASHEGHEHDMGSPDPPAEVESIDL
ncbi:MAG: hypothetical protein ABEH78_07990 [Haloferacaceae archaeon]